jgi:quinol monooxygenase YgiN
MEEEGWQNSLRLDERVNLSTQMEESVAPVILINKFNVKAEDDLDEFVRVWTTEAQIIKQQPGCISAQLHRGIGGSSVFLNYAVWESTEHYIRAFNSPEFQSGFEEYPARTVSSAHLFKKL